MLLFWKEFYCKHFLVPLGTTRRWWRWSVVALCHTSWYKWAEVPEFRFGGMWVSHGPWWWDGIDWQSECYSWESALWKKMGTIVWQAALISFRVFSLTRATFLGRVTLYHWWKQNWSFQSIQLSKSITGPFNFTPCLLCAHNIFPFVLEESYCLKQ